METKNPTDEFTREPNKTVPMKDLSYASLGKEKLEEKGGILQAIYDRHFFEKATPDSQGRQHVFFNAGYFFIPRFAERTVVTHGEKRAFNNVRSHHENKLLHFDQASAREVEEAKDTLSLEYKIHLMPKPEYSLFILDKLLDVISKDRSLQETVSTIKILNDEHKKRRQIMPTIVVYTQLGKDNAQRALDKLFVSLHEYAEVVGSDDFPRYNQKVDPLIYYANGGGDFKNSFLEMLKITKKGIGDQNIFDEDMIHFAGDTKLEVPGKRDSLT